MISLHNLTYFHSLARNGSFAATAEELNVSQPALTRSIQSLERHFGLRLVERERGRTGISLTPAGVRLLRQADIVMGDLSALERSVADRSDEPDGRLAFGVGPQFASLLLPDVMERIVAEHRDLRIRVTTASTGAMLEQLLEGGLEFFISGHLEKAERPQRVRSEKFASVPLRYFVRAGHPLLDEPEVTPALIGQYPRFAGSMFSERIASEDDEVVRHLGPTLTMDNFDLLSRFAVEYDGVLASFEGGARDPSLRPLDFDLHGLLGSSVTFLYSLEGIRMSRMGQLVVGDLRHALARRRTAARSH